MAISRRRLMAGVGTTTPALALSPASALADPPERLPSPPAEPSLQELARDERFWREIATQFNVSQDFLNLEAGYYGIMSDPVRATYHRKVDELNAVNSYLLRRTYKPEANAIAERIAGLLGVHKDEIVLTQSGTEALQNLISGYNRLSPGDSVMYSDLDYPDMKDTMDWLRDRRGVRVVSIDIPEPPTRQAVLDTYAAAFRDNPAVKLLLLSHVNNRTGLAAPVREITDLARANGIDVILDSAHAWGQLDFTLPELGVDFAGFSLHKWIGAPLGTGFLHIRKERLGSIDTVFADESYPADDIRSRVVSGTRDVANALSVPTALDYHEALGAPVKQARLQYLRDCWVHAVSDVSNIEILTPEDKQMYGALTSFRITGRTSEEDNKAIVQYLFDRYKIFTVERTGPARGACVRVTPALYNLREHIDHFVMALRDVAQRFRV